MAIRFEPVEFGSPLYRALLDIRYEVLRKPLGMELREKDIASDAGEYHLAAFDGQQPVACVLLRPLEAEAIQLRQMAVLEAYRGRHIGAQLVAYAEEFAGQKGFAIMEARARKNVQEFYEKLGYQSHAQEFADEHTLKMSKVL